MSNFVDFLVDKDAILCGYYLLCIAVYRNRTSELVLIFR